jgi:hypothetical protein
MLSYIRIFSRKFEILLFLLKSTWLQQRSKIKKQPLLYFFNKGKLRLETYETNLRMEMVRLQMGKEELEDTKMVIRSRKSKDRQYNG